MATEPTEKFASIVNASGFAFQLAVEAQLRDDVSHGWDIVSRERPWLHAPSGDSGFVDLVLQKHAATCVVECKRTRGGTWIFLVPENDPPRVERIRGLWHAGVGKRQTCGVDDFPLLPHSLESTFCSIRGSGERDQSLLERVSSKLVRAVDCMAEEKMRIQSRGEEETYGVSIPIILTTAELRVCRFDPKAVSLSDGLVKDATYEPVRWIRLRKAFVTDAPYAKSTSDFASAGLEQERTVLVLNAVHLVSFLQQMRIEPGRSASIWPWVNALRRLKERAG